MTKLAWVAFSSIALALGGTLSLAQMPASAQTASSAVETQPAVIQSNARLVVLDVIVTDSHGRAVPGLTLADFLLRENGATQTLKSLDDHTGAAAAFTPASAPLPKGTYSNRPPVQSNVWNLLVLDLLNTSQEDQSRTRQQVLQFSKTLPPGVPVALVVVSASSAKVVAPFALSGAAIENALSGKDASPVPSPLLDVYSSDGEAMQKHLIMDGVAGAPPGASAFLKSAKVDAQLVEMNRLDMRVEQTLRSLDGIARWLGQYPGKKNLYWLSSGFPISAAPQGGRDVDSPGASEVYRRSYLRLQQQTDKELESARVAVFPIDVRGNTGADREGVDTADIQGSRIVKSRGPVYNDDLTQADRRVNESQAGMVEMADATGGLATMNRNGVADILRDQFQQAERFYTLSYAPRNSDWNGEYRKIDLALAKRGYKLYYRHGYFAVDAPSAGNGPAENNANAFSLAMRHGAAPASAVLFTTRLEHAPDGDLNLFSNIDLHTLSLAPTGEDRKVASVDCAAVEFDEAGNVLGTSQIHVETRLKPGQAAQLQYIPAQQKVPVMAGTRWIAIGIRDHGSGRFGTLQVPLEAQ